MHFDNHVNVLNDECHDEYLHFPCIRPRFKCHSGCSSVFDERTYTSYVVYARSTGRSDIITLFDGDHVSP